jgi:hypothetical protein
MTRIHSDNIENEVLREQLTLNQRVQGSSPCAPTSKINSLCQLTTAMIGLNPVSGNIVGNILQISQLGPSKARMAESGP